MKKKNEKTYKIGEVAEMLGVHEDTLRNWDEQGLVVADRVGTRQDRRYTVDHIRLIKEKDLISNLARRQPAGEKDYSEYTKEQLIKELRLLREQKKYGLVWEDKTEEVVERCKREAPILESIKKMCVDDKEKKQRHIMIEGDNYHALQVLNYTHKGKVDVIYIDPPYNTGAKDWKYNNDYVDSEDPWKHSKWASMMYKRLVLAEKLLKRDGALICAIDDYELNTLGLLLHEIFPTYEKNVIVVEHHPQGAGSSTISRTHEYAYVLTPKGVGISGRKESEKEDRWSLRRSGQGENNWRENRPNQFFAILVDVKLSKVIGVGPAIPKDENNYPRNNTPEGYLRIYPLDKNGGERVWRYNRETMMELIKEGVIEYTKQGALNVHKSNVVSKPIFSVWKGSRYNAGTNGTNRLTEILGKLETFPYPKSLYTVFDMIDMIVKRKADAVVLDFFAGSGTTGHAIMEMNKEDGGNRQFILCTNNENNNGNGHGGIAESVCQPRIKKVMEGYKKNGNGEKVAGLGGSLEYLRTEFVDVDNIGNVPDSMRLNFTHKAGHVIALKENTFIEQEKNNWYQIFTDGANKYVGLYFREDIDKLDELEKKVIDKNEVKLYIFSHGSSDDWTSDYDEYDHVTVEDIPEPILRVYKHLNS